VSTIHILRDCIFAQQVWNKLLTKLAGSQFFGSDL